MPVTLTFGQTTPSIPTKYVPEWPTLVQTWEVDPEWYGVFLQNESLDRLVRMFWSYFSHSEASFGLWMSVHLPHYVKNNAGVPIKLLEIEQGSDITVRFEVGVLTLTADESWVTHSKSNAEKQMHKDKIVQNEEALAVAAKEADEAYGVAEAYEPAPLPKQGDGYPQKKTVWKKDNY